MPRQLYTVARDGELWLENPLLITGNPRRSKMARRARRRKYSRSRSRTRRTMANPRRRRRSYHRRRYQRNPGLMLNPGRRRRRKVHHRRRYKRNPAVAGALGRGGSIMGFSLPPMDAVLFTGVGFITPPLVTSFILRFIPAQYQANQGVIWAVKAASVLVPPMLVKKFVSQRAGNLMLLGGAVSLAIDLVKTYAPGVIPGLGSQPFLGRYYDRGMGAYVRRNQLPGGGRALQGPRDYQQPGAIFGGVPERLSPANRF